jgi:hypothetical protein
MNDDIRYGTYFPDSLQLNWDLPEASRITFAVIIERFDQTSRVNFEAAV